MEWAHIITSFIGTLAWPAVIVWLAAFTFREPIERLIDRIRKIGREGLEAAPPTQSEDVHSPDPENELKARADINPLVQKWLDLLRDELNKLDSANSLDADRETVLLRALARTSLAAHYEHVYRLIWGSQLLAIEDINILGGAAAVEVVKARYDAAASSNRDIYANYSFEQWLWFLEAAILVKRTGNQVLITDEGRHFLLFLTERGYSRYKPW